MVFAWQKLKINKLLSPEELHDREEVNLEREVKPSCEKRVWFDLHNRTACGHNAACPEPQCCPFPSCTVSPCASYASCNACRRSSLSSERSPGNNKHINVIKSSGRLYSLHIYMIMNN